MALFQALSALPSKCPWERWMALPTESIYLLVLHRLSKPASSSEDAAPWNNIIGFGRIGGECVWDCAGPEESRGIDGLLPTGWSPNVLIWLSRLPPVWSFPPTFRGIISGSECMGAQSCFILCGPVDCSPPGSSVHGILQARVLEWVSISSFRGSSWPRDWTHVSCIGGRILHHWATWKALAVTALYK